MGKKSNYAWFVWLGMALLMTCASGILYNCQSQFIAPILERFPEWSRAQFTMSSTVQLVCNCILMLTIGKLLNKFGCKIVLIIGGVCMVAYIFICSFATSLPMFYLAYGLNGIGMGAITISVAPVLINTWFAKKQGSLLGAISTIASLTGMVFATLIGVWIGKVGYQGTFKYLLVIIGICTVIGCVLVKDKPDKGVLPMWYEKKEANEAATPELTGIFAKEALKKPTFYLIWLAVFLMIGTFSVVMQLMCVYASVDLGFSATASGTILSVYCLVNCALQIPVGSICDKYGAKISFVLGAGVFVVATVLLAFMGSLPPWMMYVVSGLIGFCMIMALVPVQILIAQVYGSKDMGTIIGYIFTASTMGGAVLMPIFNLLYDVTGGYSIAWIVSIVLVVIALFVIMGVLKDKKGKAA